jgi:hypothetical protein
MNEELKVMYNCPIVVDDDDYENNMRRHNFDRNNHQAILQ